MESIRPWGNYEVLKTDNGYQIKILNIYATKRLSLQMHMYREETWYVVAGRGMAQVEGAEILLYPGVIVNVPMRATHRITATTDLKIIEIQTGSYFGEDDIIRLDDDYGRVV